MKQGALQFNVTLLHLEVITIRLRRINLYCWRLRRVAAGCPGKRGSRLSRFGGRDGPKSGWPSSRPARSARFGSVGSLERNERVDGPKCENTTDELGPATGPTEVERAADCWSRRTSRAFFPICFAIGAEIADCLGCSTARRAEPANDTERSERRSTAAAPERADPATADARSTFRFPSFRRVSAVDADVEFD